MDFLKKITLQTSKYDCNPNDSLELESLQQEIQTRIRYLNENGLETFNDSVLLGYYDLYQQIQGCLFQDHTDQYIIIGIILIIIPFIIFFRMKMITEPKEIEGFYDELPDNAKDQIEERDADENV